jgi:hypothetical protein
MRSRYLKNIPFIGFLALLGIVYIWNSHSAEKKLRKIEMLKKDVKESKWKYMQVKKDIMFEGTESRLAKKVSEQEIKKNEDSPIVLKGVEG